MHEAARPQRQPPAAVARLLTAPGEGGIAVVALRGEGAEAALGALFRGGSGGIARGWIEEGGRRIDEALVWRAGGGIEIGLHGGAAAAASVLRAFRRAGVPTETGTPAGTIEADAAALLPRAATLPAAMFLAAAADGALSREIESGDPARLRALLDRASAGAALAVPRTVVIAGPPNAGKSTLLNALARHDRALVHAAAGTTRDPVEAVCDFEGYPVRVVDTAGLEGSRRGACALEPGIDAEAQSRSREAAAAADLVLWLEDPGTPSPPSFPALRLSGKSDLGRAVAGSIPVSGATGEGLDALRQSALRALGLPFPADARPAPFRPAHLDLVRARLR